MKAISMTAWRRPKYLERVLNSLKACSGIEDYVLYIGIDGGGDDAVLSLARKVSFVPCDILVHNHHVGCNINTKHVLMYAFMHFDYVVHLEDDTPLAPDGLRFFEWASQFGADKTVFTTSAWGLLPRPEKHPSIPADAHAVRRAHFSCWAWATWRDRWTEMQQGWTTGDDMSHSWDYRLDEIRGARHQVQPLVSRTVNIGAELGTHRGDHPLSDWAGVKDFKAPDTYIADWK